MSNAGVHIVIGPRNGFGPFVKDIAAGKGNLALVKCVDDFGPATEALQADPNTLTVGRINVGPRGIDLQAWEPRNYPSPQIAAEAYFAIVMPMWGLNPDIKIWETFNEYSGNWSWQADFYIRLIELCEPWGISLGLWSCSGGNPPLPSLPASANKRTSVMLADRAEISVLTSTEQPWEAFARACRAAKFSSVQHYLCLHEYAWVGLLSNSWGNGVVGRYEAIDAYLSSVDAELPMLLTEVGQNGGGGFIGDAAFINDVAFYDAKTMQHSRVKGIAFWTLGNWSGANFQTALPELRDYIITHPNPAPDPDPVPEPRAYDRVCHLLPQSATYDQVLNIQFDAYPNRQTVMFSVDDAFVKPPECKSRTVHVWYMSQFTEFHGSAAELKAWVQQHYAPLPTIIIHE